MNSYLTNLSAEERLIALDEILGDEERVEVPTEDQPALWENLSTLEPLSSASSLHISENIYLFHGHKYVALWELASPNEHPFTIELIRPRKRLVPQQLELF